ncbi:hypothetical protein [Paraliomyxa miuraensis]|uniref:hypothetical protein n=1 Tax=Paraliomyxa miuraensis TaxID=376150 RepID=UPI0022599BB2|nr:hypothetical protein [Paraliomyxa miuraensis]MCX4240064.1 hypothetical protein [Paraliomyxa miuraensis]
MVETLTLRCLLCLVVTACGLRVEDEHGEDDVEPDVADQGCEEGSCPIACGDRTCIGSLGIGRCVDDKCSPTPIECVIESSPEGNCTEVCASRGFFCVENGCEGATAFGYPGTEIEAISVCGESTPDVKAAVERIEGPCDAPLVFSGEGSFALYQCCCDHPDY